MNQQQNKIKKVSHQLFDLWSCCILLFFRTHANGSIKRGSKDNATDAVQLRTGIGVQLKDIKVFNKARQQGRNNVLNLKP